MSVDRQRLSVHLDDYFRVTGRKTGQFVCPITLRECDEEELVDAHILNEAFLKASRRRVIQYGSVDHFYGSRVEAGLVRFLNLRHESDLDILTESGELSATLPDGSHVPAILAGSGRARHAEGHFPRVELTRDGRTVASIYLKMPFGAPMPSGQIEVSRTRVFAPSDWVAALLKAGHLALFEIVGYRAVFSAYGDTIRRSLKRFYQDCARREDADEYFRDFREAVKVIGARSRSEQGDEVQTVYPFDTLTDREVLLHFTPGRTMFAATCVFKINDATVAVTLPESTPEGDPALVLDWYKCCTEDPLSRPQSVHRSRFDGTAWRTEEKVLQQNWLEA
jgi:hypothetical protein